MRQIVQRITVLAVAVLFALPVSAAKEDKAEKKKKGLENSPAMSVFNLPKTITLTAEQQPKFDAIKTEFEGKLKELAEKHNNVLTAEQKKAKQEAQKAAKAAGKKGKEAKADVDAAVKLTDEQKKQEEEISKEIKEIHGKVREKLNTVLTAEQQSQLKPGKKKKEKSAA